MFFFFEVFNVSKWTDSPYKATRTKKVIQRRANELYKYSIFKSGGLKDDAHYTFDSMMDHLVTSVIKNKRPGLYQQIKSKMLADKYIEIKDLKIKTNIDSNVGRFLGAMYACYITRTAIRKLQSFIKYESNSKQPVWLATSLEYSFFFFCIFVFLFWLFGIFFTFFCLFLKQKMIGLK